MQQLEEALGKSPFAECGATQERSAGWVPPRGEPHGPLGASELRLALAGKVQGEPDAAFFERLGLLGPWTQPVLDKVIAGGAAEKAGLRQGDLVLRVGSTLVDDGTRRH